MSAAPEWRGKAKAMAHDYKRHGTRTPFAALDVLEGKVIGRYARERAGFTQSAAHRPWYAPFRGLRYRPYSVARLPASGVNHHQATGFRSNFHVLGASS